MDEKQKEKKKNFFKMVYLWPSNIFAFDKTDKGKLSQRWVNGSNG